MMESADNIEEKITQLTAQHREMHTQTMAELSELKTISQQQLQIATQQTDSIKSLAQAFVEQARAYREFSRTLPDVVEASRRAAQASEGASFMAQRTLEAMRDLIEELRDQRNS
jgi:methyl-accepting chemotaxis protein